MDNSHKPKFGDRCIAASLTDIGIEGPFTFLFEANGISYVTEETDVARVRGAFKVQPVLDPWKVLQDGTVARHMNVLWVLQEGFWTCGVHKVKYAGGAAGDMLGGLPLCIMPYMVQQGCNLFMAEVQQNEVISDGTDLLIVNGITKTDDGGQPQYLLHCQTFMGGMRTVSAWYKRVPFGELVFDHGALKRFDGHYHDGLVQVIVTPAPAMPAVSLKLKGVP